MQCFSNKTIWILHMVTKNQKAKTTGKSSTNKKKNMPLYMIAWSCIENAK